MLPVSDTFLATIRGPHTIAPRAKLVTPGQTGADPTGTELRVIEGTVTLDSTADVWGSLDLTLAEPWPSGTGVTSIVPYGSEIAVSRGVYFGNGTVERCPLGIYRITDVGQDDAPAGPLRVTAQDRMSGIIEARLLAPVQYLAGQTVGAVISDLVTAVYPSAVIEYDDATNLATLARGMVAEEDRFAFLRDLVKAYGKIMHFDYRGVLVVRTPPDSSASVWQASAGAGGVLVKARRALSRQDVYNAVAATGEALDNATPARAVAYDLNPASPTYYPGAYGRVPRFYSSPFITTNAQALAAAQSILAQSLGLPYSVDLTLVPNPALEPLDPVTVVYPPVLGRTPTVATEVHVIDKLTIPLGASGALEATTRLQTGLTT